MCFLYFFLYKSVHLVKEKSTYLEFIVGYTKFSPNGLDARLQIELS